MTDYSGWTDEQVNETTLRLAEIEKKSAQYISQGGDK